MNIAAKSCVLEVDLEYHTQLCELHNYYPLALERIEIKKEMLSKHQVLIADLYNIPVGIFKKCYLTFLIKKSMSFIMETYNFI